MKLFLQISKKVTNYYGKKLSKFKEKQLSIVKKITSSVEVSIAWQSSEHLWFVHFNKRPHCLPQEVMQASLQGHSIFSWPPKQGLITGTLHGGHGKVLISIWIENKYLIRYNT